MTPRILVAGIGNVFLGDDGFGVEVVRRLARRPLPDGVRVTDFGIRGFDLAHALGDGYAAVILVDATHRDGPPGSLYVLEPNPDGPNSPDSPDLLVDTHAMDPVKVLRLAQVLGGGLPRLRLVGCEPATTEANAAMELSGPVEAAVGPAIELIHSLIAEMLDPHHVPRGLDERGNSRCMS